MQCFHMPLPFLLCDDDRYMPLLYLHYTAAGLQAGTSAWSYKGMRNK